MIAAIFYTIGFLYFASDEWKTYGTPSDDPQLTKTGRVICSVFAGVVWLYTAVEGIYNNVKGEMK